MARYIALLKGINVGGHKRVAMADLRAMLDGIGYADVTTYLQSGNALFTARGRAAAKFAGEIEQAIEADLGMTVRVAVRTAGELADVVARSPLGGPPENPRRYFVGFLTATPDGPAAEHLQLELAGAIAASRDTGDRIWLSGAEAFFWCPDGFSLLDHAGVIEKRLGVAVTTRNWNTVSKLAELSAEQ